MGAQDDADSYVILRSLIAEGGSLRVYRVPAAPGAQAHEAGPGDEPFEAAVLRALSALSRLTRGSRFPDPLDRLDAAVCTVRAWGSVEEARAALRLTGRSEPGAGLVVHTVVASDLTQAVDAEPELYAATASTLHQLLDARRHAAILHLRNSVAQRVAQPVAGATKDSAPDAAPVIAGPADDLEAVGAEIDDALEDAARRLPTVLDDLKSINASLATTTERISNFTDWMARFREGWAS